MSFLIGTLCFVMMAISLFMILLVLIQRGRGGGLAGAFGGMGGQSAFGTRAGDMFTKITVILAVVWVMLAGGIGMLMRRDAEAAKTGKDDGGFRSGEQAGKIDDEKTLGEATQKFDQSKVKGTLPPVEEKPAAVDAATGDDAKTEAEKSDSGDVEKSTTAETSETPSGAPATPESEATEETPAEPDAPKETPAEPAASGDAAPPGEPNP